MNGTGIHADEWSDDSSDEVFEAAVTGGEVPVGVYGLGARGLLEAGRFAALTGDTVGADSDGSVVRALKDARVPVGIAAAAAERVTGCLADGSLRVISNHSVVADWATIHVVAVSPAPVPGPIDEQFRELLQAVAGGLRAGDLVCITTPTSPGTVRRSIVPHLACEAAVEESQYGVAYCPRWVRGTGRNCRLVAGRDRESTQTATRVYELAADGPVVAVSDLTTAERVQLVRELARLTEDSSQLQRFCGTVRSR